jgi:hypothetical protein
MKPFILLFPLCCASFSMSAQSLRSASAGTPSAGSPSADTASAANDPTPYDPRANYRTWSIKGKVLPYPALGNAGGVTVLLGLEYGFARNQSIGVDVFANWSEDSDDNVADTAGVQHTTGSFYNGSEKALFLNYRYYLNCRRLRDRKGAAPYLLFFLRDGKIYQHYDPLYPLWRWQANRERQYSAGLMVGVTSAISDDKPKRLDWDLNLGIFEKLKEISTVYLKDGVQSTVKSRPIGPGFRLSLNLVYWFYIGKDHSVN